MRECSFLAVYDFYFFQLFQILSIMNYFLSAQKINPQIKLPAPSVENKKHTFNHYQTVREQYAQNKHLTHFFTKFPW